MSWLSRFLKHGTQSPPGKDGEGVTATGQGGQPAAKPLAGLSAVNRLTLPRRLADQTQSSLRAAGRGGDEGMVLWSGIQQGNVFAVRTVTVPQQRPIKSAEGVCVIVDGDALHQFNVQTFRRGERLVAQVHSHPGRAYHSSMDDRYAVVTSPGGLSLVVPDFATRSFDPAECAVYRLAASGAWRAVPARTVMALISILD